MENRNVFGGVQQKNGNGLNRIDYSKIFQNIAMTSGVRQKTNTAQLTYLLDFMDSQPYLVFGREGKDRSEQLWQELSSELNKRGPPVREVKNWKGVWNTLKSNDIKRMKIRYKWDFSKKKTKSVKPTNDIPINIEDLPNKSSSTDCRCSVFKKEIEELKSTNIELRKTNTKMNESISELKDKIIQLQAQEFMKNISAAENNSDLKNKIIELQDQVVKLSSAVELPISRRLTGEFAPGSSGKCDSAQDIQPPEKIKTEKFENVFNYAVKKEE